MDVVFFGSSEISVLILKTLHLYHNIKVVVTIPVKKSGRGYTYQDNPVTRQAKEWKIPIMVGIPNIQDIPKVPIGIVASFGLLIPDDILDFFPLGCVNIHPSLLPKWRGASPIQQSLYHGDHHIGVCLMKMEHGLDTGPVLYKWQMDRIPLMNAEKIANILGQVAGYMLLDYLSCPKDFPAISQDSINSQDSIKPSYAKKVLKSQYVISWDASASNILNHIFAYYPYAYTYLGKKRFRILYACMASYILESSNSSCAIDHTMLAGTIISTKPFMILTGERGSLDRGSLDRKILQVERVQLEGKKPMDVQEFLLGYPITIGTILQSHANEDTW